MSLNPGSAACYVDQAVWPGACYLNAALFFHLQNGYNTIIVSLPLEGTAKLNESVCLTCSYNCQEIVIITCYKEGLAIIKYYYLKALYHPFIHLSLTPL